GQLHLLLGTVELDIVFNLHARRAVARDELLRTRFACHCLSLPLEKLDSAVYGDSRRIPPRFSIVPAASGARSRLMSTKLRSNSRAARRIRIGAGWAGSVRSGKWHTDSSMRRASARVVSFPRAPSAPVPLAPASAAGSPPASDSKPSASPSSACARASSFSATGNSGYRVDWCRRKVFWIAARSASASRQDSSLRFSLASSLSRMASRSSSAVGAVAPCAGG